MVVDRFLIECRLNETEEITAASQNQGKQYEESLRPQGKKRPTAGSAGKRKRPRFSFVCDWLRG